MGMQFDIRQYLASGESSLAARRAFRAAHASRLPVMLVRTIIDDADICDTLDYVIDAIFA